MFTLRTEALMHVVLVPCRCFLVPLTACVALASSGSVSAQDEASPALPGRAPESRTAVTLEGFVLAPDGSPAEGAVVVTSAGGRTVTDFAGSYRLEIELPLTATNVHVTAVGRERANLVAS